jgi:hypothetical protein
LEHIVIELILAHSFVLKCQTRVEMLAMANTLVYNTALLITAIKIFTVQVPHLEHSISFVTFEWSH